MAQPKYAAGIHFVVNKTDQASSSEHRKARMSHATKSQWKRRKNGPLQSWINPGQSIRHTEMNSELLARNHLVQPMPRLKMVGGDFSATKLPPGIEPAAIQDLVKIIELGKFGTYPYEVCLHVHVVERGWFPYMISDICCIHSMMFALRAYVDQSPQSGGVNRLAAFHYSQTLHHLQARINASERCKHSFVFDDSTIMVVINLAMAAELEGDLATARTHVDGLLKMVSLRGGLKSLNVHNNLQVKVCRADLTLSLRQGTTARLFRDAIEWGCFIAGRGLIRCSHGPYEDQIGPFVATLDPKLANCWKDIHSFSCLSNLAYQTDRKLSSDTYNEMMISILYRLMHLPSVDEVVPALIRTALLTYCSALFLTRMYHQGNPYEHLIELFSTQLWKLHQSASIGIPRPVVLWLLVTYHWVVYNDPSPKKWQTLWLDETIALGRGAIWADTNKILKSVMWVDFVHDALGIKIFDAAMERLRLSYQ